MTKWVIHGADHPHENSPATNPKGKAVGSSMPQCFTWNVGVVFRLALAPIVETRRRDIRVAQPFLHLRDVRFM